MVTELDRTLGALADPTRRGVIDMLRERPHRAGELATALAMSGPAMSRHLRLLRVRGLIEEERAAVEEDARFRTYRLRQEPFLALRGWLDQLEAFWDDQLGAFKAHAEAQHAAQGDER